MRMKKKKKKDVRSVCRVGQTFSSAVEQGLRDGERCQAIFTIYTKFSQTEEILSELIRKVTTNARKKKRTVNISSQPKKKKKKLTRAASRHRLQTSYHLE